MIADVIRSEKPDVVGLQEVDRFWARSGTVDQPAYLAKKLGMFYCYAANLDHQPDNHSSVPHQYGTAVLSQLPILDCANTFLPRTSTRNEQRGLLAARINVRGVPLLFLNTHLHTTQADRLIQVPAIVNLIAGRTEPRVLVGDLNATPVAPELAPLYSTLVDAWVAAGVGQGFTYPAEIDTPPNRRIDYVFVSKDVTVTSMAVAERPMTALASDHYPVTANVNLPGTAVGIGPQK
jgi:endonuclease/exonuclease/phosphatase family metal-dependent hydrolase